MHFKCENQNISIWGKGIVPLQKNCFLISFLARSLLYNNLLLEAIVIISMVMVVEGVGVLGYGILCTFMGDGIEKSHHPRL